jgi:hypothetical protein
MSNVADTQVARADVDGDGSGGASVEGSAEKASAPGLLTRWQRWRARELPSVELRKMRGLIDVRHFELDRLLDVKSEHQHEATRQARNLRGGFDASQASLHECADHLDELEELTPRLLDRDALYVLLHTELRREDEFRKEGKRMPIGKLFNREELETIARRYRPSASTNAANGSQTQKVADEEQLALDTQRVRESLALLARERNDESRHRRVTREEKLHLTRTFLLGELLGLTVALVVSATYARDGGFTSAVWFAAFAGALGGTLGGAFKVRDTLDWDDVKGLRQAILIQPLLGSGAGLVLFFVYLQAHGVEGDYWLAGGISAFVGGFSEPFFLRTVAALTKQASN